MVIVINARWHSPRVTLSDLENLNNEVANGLKPNKHYVLVSQDFLESSGFYKVLSVLSIRSLTYMEIGVYLEVDYRV